METITMLSTPNQFDMRLVAPLMVAHQFYRLFQATPSEALVVLAADAVNKTKPREELKARLDTKASGVPDSLFLLNNLDCLTPLPPEEWPKRLMNKTKWGDFSKVMSGLEIYLAKGPAPKLSALTKTELKDLLEMLAFITFDADEKISSELVMALQAEQGRIAKHAFQSL